jgi:membrane associated rhomboid family serine protease
MDDNKSKEGVSVKEIEKFAKKHRFEVFFSLTFILACFFSFIMWGTGIAIALAALGAVLGVIFPVAVEFVNKKVFHFIFKQEDITQIILAVVALILAIVVPPLIFFLLGAHGGKDYFHKALEIYSQNKK